MRTLLGFFGSYWWAFDALANLRPQYAIVLLVVAALYGLVLARGAAFLFLAVGVLNVWLVRPLYTGTPADAVGREDIKLVSFNVSTSADEQARVLSWAKDTEPDLAFLLESTQDWESEIRSSNLRYRIQNEIPEERRFGITVLSRGHVDTEMLIMGTDNDPVVRVETDLGGQPLVVYVVHPRSATSRAGSEARDSLFDEVAEMVAEEIDPVVVIGDLNATPWSHAFRGLVNEADLVSSLDGYGLQGTWPGNFPFGLTIPIDHLLTSTVRHEPSL